MAQFLSSETKSYIKLVTGTLAFIGLISAINILIILNSVGSEIFKPLQRNIASVSNETSTEETLTPSLLIEFDCKKNQMIAKTQTLSGNLRLLFHSCKKVSRPANLTNNSQADLFSIGNQAWTSDFISLSPGENKVSFQYGKRTQIIEIIRETIKESTDNKAL